MEPSHQQLSISYRRSQRAKNLRITITPVQAVTVTVPANLSLQQAKDFAASKQEWIEKHLAKLRQLEKQRPKQPKLSHDELIDAQEALFARLDHFSAKHNLPYRKAAFRCQKTKWGSCSSRNNISLNINIAFLPRHLQDYLLLHELCHIRHKNHSKAFWTQLDQYCDRQAKEYAKELRGYRMKIRR